MADRDGTFTIKRASYMACDCVLNATQWDKLFDDDAAGKLKGIYRFAGTQVCNTDVMASERPTFQPFDDDGTAKAKIETIAKIAAANDPNNQRVAFVNWAEQPIPRKPAANGHVTVTVAAAVMGEVVFTPFAGERLDQRVNLCSGFYAHLP